MGQPAIQNADSIYCLQCGFDLTREQARRCPQCGRPYHAAIAATIRRRRPRTARAWMSRSFIRLAIVAFGLTIAGGLYFLIARKILLPAAAAPWPIIHPKAAAAIAFLGALPACLFVASFITGYILQPLLRGKTIQMLLHSPGLYLLVICLGFWSQQRSPWFFALMLLPAAAWVYASYLGSMLGRNLHLHLLAGKALRTT